MSKSLAPAPPGRSQGENPERRLPALIWTGFKRLIVIGFGCGVFRQYSGACFLTVKFVLLYECKAAQSNMNKNVSSENAWRLT